MTPATWCAICRTVQAEVRGRSSSAAGSPAIRTRYSSAYRRSRLPASLRSPSVKRAQSLSSVTVRPSQVSGTVGAPASTTSISARWSRRWSVIRRSALTGVQTLPSPTMGAPSQASHVAASCMISSTAAGIRVAGSRSSTVGVSSVGVVSSVLVMPSR
ncbi:MAG TPA: hypothetical protein VHZ33_07545 [Trebonia sp.]|nr:hypothetical protein [Trebonia sp.]